MHCCIHDCGEAGTCGAAVVALELDDAKWDVRIGLSRADRVERNGPFSAGVVVDVGGVRGIVVVGIGVGVSVTIVDVGVGGRLDLIVESEKLARNSGRPSDHSFRGEKAAHTFPFQSMIPCKQKSQQQTHSLSFRSLHSPSTT